MDARLQQQQEVPAKKKETRGRKPKPKDDSKKEEPQSQSQSKMKKSLHQHSVDDRYSQWKSIIPVLYDWFANHNLVWPSLSCRYSPFLGFFHALFIYRVYLCVYRPLSFMFV